MNRRAVCLAVLLSLALVACHSSTSNRSATSTSPASTMTSAPAPAPAQSGTRGAATPGTASVLPQIGPRSGLTYTDGLAVSVVFATTFTPSSDAVGSTAGDVAVLFAVRITNGSTTPYHAVVVSVTASAGASDTQCTEIFQDGPPNLGNTFVGYISPGQSQTAQFGFDVPAADVDDVRVSVQPDPHYAPVTLTTQVAHV
jgi:hypothetical protein